MYPIPCPGPDTPPTSSSNWWQQQSWHGYEARVWAIGAQAATGMVAFFFTYHSMIVYNQYWGISPSSEIPLICIQAHLTSLGIVQLFFLMELPNLPLQRQKLEWRKRTQSHPLKNCISCPETLLAFSWDSSGVLPKQKLPHSPWLAF